MLLGSILGLSSATEAAVILSEYVEGSSFNKALEIFNTGDESVGLAGYSVRIFFNGNPSAMNIIELPTQTLAHGETLVIAHPQIDDRLIDLSKIDMLDFRLLFNGNDAVGLYFLDSPVDVIGQAGHDPGDEWGTGQVTTRDHTLRRRETVLTGDPIAGDPFDPALQWIGFPQNTLGDLGHHTVIPEPISMALLLSGLSWVPLHLRWGSSPDSQTSR